MATRQADNLAHLTSWEAESDFFRFGNGGRLKSDRRWALSVCIEGRPLFLRVSVVASPMLGALLGKDLFFALGVVLDSERDCVSSSVLGVNQAPVSELLA